MVSFNRRDFIQLAGIGSVTLGLGGLRAAASAAEKPIQGFDDTATNIDTTRQWKPTTDRKLKVGLAGFGLCQFGTAFGFQDHPNVEVVAVTDLIPDRCAKMAIAARCAKTYPSLEEMIKDDSIEAVFVATDAPSHARQAIESLKRGKHVASAVPAVWRNLDEAQELFDTVKSTGLNYMMFETSAFHDDLYAARVIQQAGGLGRLIYTEGEYYHYMEEPLQSYKEWRLGLPPMWYPTHATAYQICVDGSHFTEVSCMGLPSALKQFQPEGNAYGNPFGTEVALFRTAQGGMSRMAISWDSYGFGAEAGRIRGEKGSVVGSYQGQLEPLPDVRKPALPPGVDAGGHGGSHGYLMNEFVTSILEKRKPLIDVAWSLNMTVPGLIAHQSALKGGETMKVPFYTL